MAIRGLRRAVLRQVTSSGMSAVDVVVVSYNSREHLRSCVDGPVFNPARVLWDRWLSDAPTMLPTPPEGLPVVRSWPG